MAESPTPTALSNALALLTSVAERDGTPWIRVGLANGTFVQGELVGIAPDCITIADESALAPIDVPAHDVRTIDQRVRSRGREWLLAMCAILVGTGLLVGYTSLPWIPRQAHASADPAFAGLCFVVVIAGYFARARIQSWVDRWNSLYPPGR